MTSLNDRWLNDDRMLTFGLTSPLNEYCWILNTETDVVDQIPVKSWLNLELNRSHLVISRCFYPKRRTNEDNRSNQNQHRSHDLLPACSCAGVCLQRQNNIYSVNISRVISVSKSLEKHNNHMTWAKNQGILGWKRCGQLITRIYRHTAADMSSSMKIII